MLQLRGFSNVKDVLALLSRSIRIEMFAIIILMVILGIKKLLAKLYPRSFFLFGKNEKAFQGLQTKRQVWGIAIGVAFVVNLVAGFVVAVVMR